MKRFLLLITVCLLTFNGFAQENNEPLKQFYRTIQGDYEGQLNDSTSMVIHFTPIWENNGNQFQWLYMEAVNRETKQIVTQNILEIETLTDITFEVTVYDINSPEVFAGRWDNRSFFDGYNKRILRGGLPFVFIKTMDFEYQTAWNGRKNLKCFPTGDRIHFKFVQEDERLYIKRVPKGTTDIIGYIFFKELTD